MLHHLPPVCQAWDRGAEHERGRHVKMSDFERLPERLTSGDATYFRMWSSSVGAQYVNERDQSDVLSITTIYSFTGTEVDTNVGHFFRL